MVPWIINPIYTVYSGYLWGISLWGWCQSTPKSVDISSIGRLANGRSYAAISLSEANGRRFALWDAVATVDGRTPANQLISSLSGYLQGFIHPRWCRISSINSIPHEFLMVLAWESTTKHGKPSLWQVLLGWGAHPKYAYLCCVCWDKCCCWCEMALKSDTLNIECIP